MFVLAGVFGRWALSEMDAGEHLGILQVIDGDVPPGDLSRGSLLGPYPS